MKLLILGLAALVLSAAPLRCGSSSDRSSAIAKKIGATSCEGTEFAVTNKLDGSKTRIYDCWMPSGRERCVTEEGGIARDSTEEVKLLFQSTLGESPPSCAS